MLLKYQYFLLLYTSFTSENWVRDRSFVSIDESKLHNVVLSDSCQRWKVGRAKGDDGSKQEVFYNDAIVLLHDETSVAIGLSKNVRDPSGSNILVCDPTHEQKEQKFTFNPPLPNESNNTPVCYNDTLTITKLVSAAVPSKNKPVRVIEGGRLCVDGNTGEIVSFIVQECNQAEGGEKISNFNENLKVVDTESDDVAGAFSQEVKSTNEILTVNQYFRLWGICPSTGKGGYIGLYLKHNLIALGPGMIKDKGNSLERFLDLTFVVKPNASALAGSQAADAADPAVVRYGVPLQLKTKDGNELHKASGTVNKGYITSEKSASSSQPNILEVHFIPADVSKLNQPVSFGDCGITVKLVKRNKQGNEITSYLTNLKSEKTNLCGGYLMHDGKGQAITFRMDRFTVGASGVDAPPPPAKSDVVKSLAAVASAVAVNKGTNDNASTAASDDEGDLEAAEARSVNVSADPVPPRVDRSFELSSAALAPVMPMYTLYRPPPVIAPTATGMSKHMELYSLAVVVGLLAVAQVHFYGAVILTLALFVIYTHLATPPSYPVPVVQPLYVQAPGSSIPSSPNLSRIPLAPSSFVSPAMTPASYMRPTQPYVNNKAVVVESQHDPSRKEKKNVAPEKLPGKIPPVLGITDKERDLDEFIKDLKLADVVTDPDIEPLPIRWLNCTKKDEAKGRERLRVTLEWRKKNNIDSILFRPHPKFKIIKQFVSQSYHKTGGPVCNDAILYIEEPKKLNLKAAKEAGLELEDFIYHFIWITEYLWRVMDKDDNSKVISMVDIKGVSIGDVFADVKTFLKAANRLIGAHYPERSQRILVMNAHWMVVSIIDSLVKPIMDPSTAAKLFIKGTNPEDYKNDIQELVPLANLPVKYGGTCTCPSGDCVNSEDEQRMKEFAERVVAWHALHPGHDQGSMAHFPLLNS